MSKGLLWQCLVVSLLLLACSPSGGGQKPLWQGRIIDKYPHDRQAFTQGLLFHAGFLYESTGGYGSSSLRKVEIATGRVVRQLDLDSKYFGEGLALHSDRLYQLTWKSGIAFVYDPASFELLASHRYRGEGWGLTGDGERLILSDGTAQLRFMDPGSFREQGRLRVTDGGQPLAGINELEYIDGEIWANIFHSDRIARISPDSGRVLGWVDLGHLRPGELRSRKEVLNGIAWDDEHKRLFVTGKNWPALFEIDVAVPQD